MPKVKKITAIFLGVFILILTLLRENVFLEINAIMNGYTYNNAYFYFLSKGIIDLNLDQLSMLKWGLTISFILLISALTLFIIILWFNNKKYNRISLFVYLVFYGVITLLTLFLWLVNCYDDYYFVIRKMIGVLQSPIPLFLFSSVYLYLTSLSIKTK